MPTYTTQAAFEAYVEGWVTDNGAALDRLLARAELDVDRLLGPGSRVDATGLRYDPTKLLPWEAEALSRAVCAQAEWRFARGETDLVTAGSMKRVKGPDFEVEFSDASLAGRGLIGPKVGAELARIPHLRTTTARARA